MAYWVAAGAQPQHRGFQAPVYTITFFGVGITVGHRMTLRIRLPRTFYTAEIAVGAAFSGSAFISVFVPANGDLT